MCGPMDSDFEKKYQAEDDARAVKRVGEMKADKARVKAAKEHIDKERKALDQASSIMGSGVGRMLDAERKKRGI